MVHSSLGQSGLEPRLECKLVSSHRLSIFSKWVRHVEKELPKTEKSSINTSIVFSIMSWKIAIQLPSLDVPGALQRAKGHAAEIICMVWEAVIKATIKDNFKKKNCHSRDPIRHHQFPDLIRKYQKVQPDFFKNDKHSPSNGVRSGEVVSNIGSQYEWNFIC
ncbi:hypothetical protein Tco_0180346 [Tanacetum coccineum]